MKLDDLLYLIYDAHNRVPKVEGTLRVHKNQALALNAWHRRTFGKDFDREPRSHRPPEIEVVSELRFEWPDAWQITSIEQRTGDEWMVDGNPGEAWGVDLFDPAFLLSDYRFEQLGSDRIAGRKVLTARVRARPSLWDFGFDLLELISEVAVDAECGTLLRAIWRQEGTDIQRLEFVRINFG